MLLVRFVLTVVVFGVIGHGVVFFPLRALAARILGVRGIGVILGLDHAAWKGVSWRRRAMFALVGPLGCYLVGAALVAGGIRLAGTEVYDETSMRIVVRPGGPADEATLRDGDRLVSVNGTAIADWTELSKAIGAHPHERVDVAVERSGRTLVLSPTPNIDGKIGVGPPSERRDVSVASALGAGMARAPQSWFEAATFLAGSTDTELAGPVAVRSAMERTTPRGKFALLMMLVGAGLGFYLFVPILFALVRFPRRSRQL